MSDLDGEEHVDPAKEHGVNVEEVAGKHAVCLGLAELTPGRSGAPGYGVEAGGGEEIPHGSGGNGVAESDEFAVDAPVSPGRVLVGEPQHQRADRGAGRWPAYGCRLVRVGPRAGQEFAVPAQQGSRADETERPQWAWEVAGERCHDQPVGGLQTRPRCLTPKDSKLAAEQDEFHVLGCLTLAADHDQSQEPTGQGIHEGEQHPMIFADRCPRSSTGVRHA